MTTTDLDPTPLDPALSHTRGESDVPLLTQTIPDNLAATVERFGDRDQSNVPAGRRWTYTEFWRRPPVGLGAAPARHPGGGRVASGR